MRQVRLTFEVLQKMFCDSYRIHAVDDPESVKNTDTWQ